MAELFRYAAFISYSSKDAKFAQRLHRALEGYGIPSSLGKFDLIGGGGKKNRIYPVFRDREELSAGHLGDQIEANLKASAALIVVCSPNGAASTWVQKEIEFFAAHGRHARVFAIIPDTAPLVNEAGADCTQACFPPAFRGDALSGDKLEPLAADARRGKDGFRNAWLKIVAGMIGVSPGQIIDRDRIARRNRRIASAAAVCALLAASSFAFAWFDTATWRNRFSSRAEAISAHGSPFDSITYALAGEPARGAIITARSDRADEILRRMGAAPLIADGGNEFTVFSPRGDVLISTPERDSYHVFLRRLDAPGAEPLRVPDSGSSEGRFIAGVDEHGRIVATDLEDPEFRQVVLGAGTAVRVAGDGAVGALQVSERGALTLLNLRTGERLATVDLPLPSWFEVTPDGRFLMGIDSAQGRDRYYVYDIAAARMVLLEHSGSWDRFHLLPDGRTLLAQTRVIDLVTGRDILELSGSQVFFSPATNRLVSVDSFHRAELHDLQSRTSAPLGVVEGGLYSLSEDGSTFTASGMDGMTVFDLSRPGTARRIPDLERIGAAEVSFDGQFAAVHVIPEGSEAAGPDYIVNLGNGQRINLDVERYWDMEAGGRVLIVYSDAPRGKSITAYNLANGARAVALADAPEMGSVHVSRDGRRIAVHDWDGRVSVYDISNPLWRGNAPPSGRSFTAAICGASENAIRPFAASQRGEGEQASSEQVFPQLRGRPWHPCDWRGMLSFDDGWEGLRQWARLVAVRYLGAPDYRCEERDSRGRSDAISRARCARLAAPAQRAPE